MNKQLIRLSRPSDSWAGGSIEDPNKEVQMFLKKGSSLIQDHVGKILVNDSRRYSREATKDSFDGMGEALYDELYKAIGSGNFADLKKISNVTDNDQYAKIAQSIVQQIEVGLGADASAFKKDMALTGVAKNLNIKPISSFKSAFTSAALNGGETVTSEIRKNVESFLAQNLSAGQYEQAMREIASMFTFADGDTASRDRVVKKAADISDSMITDATR